MGFTTQRKKNAENCATENMGFSVGGLGFHEEIMIAVDKFTSFSVKIALYQGTHSKEPKDITTYGCTYTQGRMCMCMCLC